MDLDFLRTSFGERSLAALDDAAARCGRVPMTTRDAIVALMRHEPHANWSRIWLESGDVDAIAAGTAEDPAAYLDDSWHGHPVTLTCATSIRGARLLAGLYGILPVPAGILFLCLVGRPTTAAARVLTHGDATRHAHLLQLAQEVLVGGLLTNLDRALDECLAEGAMAISQPVHATNGATSESDLSSLMAELAGLHEIHDGARSAEICEILLSVLDKKEEPFQWAVLHGMAGNGLAQYPGGDRHTDVERAIEHYRAALTIFDRTSTPEQWAATLSALGAAYASWLGGIRSDNVTRAKEQWRLALTAPDLSSPSKAGILNNLGTLLLEWPEGSYARSIEAAIGTLLGALHAFGSEESAPDARQEPWTDEDGMLVSWEQEEWARAQDNLGRAYLARQGGERDDNIEHAIECFRRALTVRQPGQLTGDYAVTCAHLGEALLARSVGGRASNMDAALDAFRDALHALMTSPREKWPWGWPNLLRAFGRARR